MVRVFLWGRGEGFEVGIYCSGVKVKFWGRGLGLWYVWGIVLG